MKSTTIASDAQITKCLVIATPDISKKVEDILTPDFLCHIYESPGDMHIRGLIEHDIQCVVIHITNRNFPLLKPSIENMKQTRSFPVISLIQEIDMEVARICGKIGVDCFIDINRLRDLKKSVFDAICQIVRVLALNASVQRKSFQTSEADDIRITNDLRRDPVAAQKFGADLLGVVKVEDHR